MAADSTALSDPLLASLARLGEAVYRLDANSGELEWLAEPHGSLIDILDDPDGVSSLVEGSTKRANWIANPQSEVFEEAHRIEKDGEFHIVRERLVRIEGVHLLGFLDDITTPQSNEERLTYLACFDGLTGHYTRSHLRAELALNIVRAFDCNEDFCFAFIGLDEMATINRTLGYDVADDVLSGIGDRIAALIGDDGVLGRVASSKFGVIFSNISVDEALERLRVIQRDIREHLIETTTGAVPTTVSIGSVQVPSHARTTDQALARAEDALTTAKDMGPGAWSQHVPDFKDINARQANLKVSEQISTALTEDRILLALQPVVSTSKAFAFYECLARMVDRVGNVIPAAEFMPVAEKLGFVRLIDRRVMGVAMEALAQNSNLRLSINVSPQTLFDPSWHVEFADHATKNPGAAERLIVEITESAAIHDPDRVAEIVRDISSYGAAIAVDDFGAGYTSFSHFKSLPFDIVKIDGQFVRGITNSPENQVFVSSLASLARHFDMLVVAEMVEDDEAAALLATLGVDCLQGFHFGRPELMESTSMMTLRCDAC